MAEKTDSVDTGTGVQTPDLDPKTLKPQRRAIKDETQAWNVFRNLVQAQDKRNKLNAELSARYTGKQPRDPADLKQQGRDWESNFPTLFLAGIVDRIVPTLINSIDSARFLTQATLPEQINGEEIQDREKKIEFFRERFTQFIRRWEGWRNFSASLCQELVLIGYCSACWTDEDSVFPDLYRQDKAFVPDGAPQFAKGLQFFAIKQDVLLHDVVDSIQNREYAEAAGWDIDNCVEAVNHALPKDNTEDESNNPRAFEDLIREANQGTSYTAGAKMVQYGHLFAVEPDEVKGKGRISHMILNRRNGKLLFERERRFDTMDDVVTLFTLEPGNSTFYGSKGIARILANFAHGIDLAVNDAVNQMKIAGLKVLKTDSKSAISAQAKVRAPFVIVTSDATLEEEGFTAQVKDYVALIDKLTSMAEVAVNAYVPNQISQQEEGARARTAREATIDYTRELQAKSAFIARFAGQLAGMINNIQKRACKKDTSDDMAKEFRKELEEQGNFSDAEIKAISESPAMETVQDLTGIQNQQKAQLADQLVGNPMIDQHKLLEAKITAMTDPQFAKEIMLPDGVDPTMEAENVRQQLMENAAIMSGESMPVSPRDNDQIHLKVLISELKSSGARLMQQNPADIDPAIFDHISAALVHGSSHVQSMLKKGAKPKDVKPYQQFFQGADQMLKALAMKHREQSMQRNDQMAQVAQMMAQQQPPQQPQAQDIFATLDPGDKAKVLVGWIGQYDKLPDDEKRKLETLGGLGASQEDQQTQLTLSPQLTDMHTAPPNSEPVQPAPAQPAPPAQSAQPQIPAVGPAGAPGGMPEIPPAA